MKGGAQFWVFLGVGAYLTAWLVHYGTTPLGQSPALDCLQNQVLAQQIVAGTLPAEPFHRAPLYPLILAGLLSLVGDVEWLPVAGRVLNGLAVWVAAFCACRSAERLWGSRRAGALAAIFVGANPVVLFFAGDLYDITLALALCSGCVWAWIVWLDRREWRVALLISLLLGIGAALRSHLLPWVVAWPLLACALGGRGGHRWIQGAVGLLALAASLLITGVINFVLTDTWRTRPWQGAYALWAGNEAGADGRIYKQSRAIEHGAEFDNPAKLLSIELYAQDTGVDPPYDIDAMNRYWLDRAVSEVAADPLRWVGLILRKGYYFFNSYEQYDNRTYGLHRDRYAYLKWNPIHWGALILCTILALWVPRSSGGPAASTLAILFVVYGAGIVLFYASNRFRVPLIPLLAVAGSGVVCLPRMLAEMRGLRWWGPALALMLAAVLLYTGWFEARKKDTYEADYLMLARAAIGDGDDAASLSYVDAALQVNPESQQARLLQILVNFNLWTSGDLPLPLPSTTVKQLFHQALAQGVSNHEAAAIAGIYAWKLGNREHARRIWTQYPDSAYCWACRVVTSSGSDTPPHTQLTRLQQRRYWPFLELTLKPQGQAVPEDLNWLLELFTPAQGDPVTESVGP